MTTDHPEAETPKQAVDADRIRAAVKLLYPDEMTPTAKNVLEKILNEQEPAS